MTGLPNAVSARGCTGTIRPLKPIVAAAPTRDVAQPEFSDAPTIAMLCGVKNSRSRSTVTSSRTAFWLAAASSDWPEWVMLECSFSRSLSRSR